MTQPDTDIDDFPIDPDAGDGGDYDKALAAYDRQQAGQE
jgi:hypothetical protein